MKKVGKTVGAALLFICATVGVYFPHASAATNVHSVDCTFDPVSMPKGAGPVMLELAFTPKHRCDEVTVKVTKLLNLEYTGDTAWVVQVEKEKWYRKTLNVSIPDNDTSGIEVTLQCGRVPNTHACYFVTTGNSVEFYHGNPRGYHRFPSQPKNDEIVRDTLSRVQLQTKYVVILDLRDSADRKTAESIVGTLPDSSKFEGHEGYYKIKLTLERLIEITDKGIKGEFVTPPPWAPEYSPSMDSVLNKQPKSDTSKEQGALPFSPNGFSLDSVDGMTTPGEIPADQEITFCLRLNNNTGYNIKSSTNGFRVYSPDGAQWQPITWDTTSVGWGDMYDGLFFNDFSITGSGADTIGFGGFTIFEPGIPDGFDSVVFLISTQVDGVYDGRTLCLDSCWYPPGGEWLWSLSTDPSSLHYPPWDGPHCFTTGNSQLAVGSLL